MTYCSRPNCAEPIAEETLRLCAAHAHAYHRRQAEHAGLVDRLIVAKPRMFAHLTASSARRLAAFIIGHAAAGRTGFDNDTLSQAEIVASNDAIAESRQETARWRRVPPRRPAPPHEWSHQDTREDAAP